jgi:hypothetical protein
MKCRQLQSADLKPGLSVTSSKRTSSCGTLRNQQLKKGWLSCFWGGHARLGRLVLLGDPGRNYFSAHGLDERARYDIPTSLQRENRGMRESVVWRVLPHP